MPTTELEADSVPDEGMNIIDIMFACGLAASKGEAKRLIQQGGVLIDGEKVQTFDRIVTKDALKSGVKLRKGKKIFHRAIIKA
jgi:tyrosyl-tRNA synthetase